MKISHRSEWRRRVRAASYPSGALKRVPHAELRLAGEAAAALEPRRHEECRSQPSVSTRGGVDGVLEVRPVRDVVHVHEELQRVLRDPEPPPGSDIGL